MFQFFHLSDHPADHILSHAIQCRPLWIVVVIVSHCHLGGLAVAITTNYVAQGWLCFHCFAVPLLSPVVVEEDDEEKEDKDVIVAGPLFSCCCCRCLVPLCVIFCCDFICFALWRGSLGVFCCILRFFLSNRDFFLFTRKIRAYLVESMYFINTLARCTTLYNGMYCKWGYSVRTCVESLKST